MKINVEQVREEIEEIVGFGYNFEVSTGYDALIVDFDINNEIVRLFSDVIVRGAWTDSPEIISHNKVICNLSIVDNFEIVQQISELLAISPAILLKLHEHALADAERQLGEIQATLAARREREKKIADSMPSADEIEEMDRITWKKTIGRKVWNPYYGIGTIVKYDEHRYTITVDYELENENIVHDRSKIKSSCKWFK